MDLLKGIGLVIEIIIKMIGPLRAVLSSAKKLFNYNRTLKRDLWAQAVDAQKAGAKICRRKHIPVPMEVIDINDESWLFKCKVCKHEVRIPVLKHKEQKIFNGKFPEIRRKNKSRPPWDRGPFN